MKKLLSLLIVLALCLSFLPANVFAASTVASGTCGDNLTWTLDNEGTLTISSTGPMTNFGLEDAPWYSQRASVKKVVIESGVTSIGDFAFRGCSSLTSVTIPDSVTSIGEYAFSSCAGLTSVTIPDGVTSIGSCAFSYCTGLTSITIPNSVTSIGWSAFSSCDSLISVTIGNGVTSIGEFAFDDCRTLEEINFNATAMEDLSSSNYVFAYAGQSGNGMTVNIGANVTKIPACLFNPYSNSSYAPKITTVNFAEGSVCTSIGEYAFKNCTGLTSVTIPDSVISIGNSAFFGCTDLEQINFNATAMEDLSSSNRVFACTGQSGNGITVNIGANVTKIPAYLFNPYPDNSYAPKLKAVNFAEGSVCTSIGNYAFENCTSLTSITMPDGLTGIGACAFYGCTGLIRIDIPDSVNSIWDSAFASCTGLTSVTFGNDVVRIGYNAFCNCTSLTSVTIPDSATSIGERAFYYCTGLTDLTIGNGVSSIGNDAFSSCDSLKEIYFEGSAPTFEGNVFNNVTATAYYPDETWTEEVRQNYGGTITWVAREVQPTIIASGTCGENLTWTLDDKGTLTISGTGPMTNFVFEGAPWYSPWSSVKKVVIGSGITSIGSCAFDNCTGLTSITIPDSVTSIGSSAFSGCTGLTDLTIGNGVTSIGEDAFYKCTGLTSIQVEDGNTVYHSAGNCLIETASKTLLLGCKSSQIPTDGSVTSIGNDAFYDCDGLTSITIPDSVTSIGSSAFRYCTGLTDLTIGNGVTSIGTYAFHYCTGLTSIQVEDGNTVYHSAGNCLIETASKTLLLGCKSSQIPTDGSVTSIGKVAFSDCTGLTSITIPDSVTSIGTYAFSGCTGLTDLTIGNGVTSIGTYAFHYCTGLTSIQVEDGNTVYHSAGNCLIETASKTLLLGCKSSQIPTDGSVTSIGKIAFYSCDSLTSVTIPDSVTSIGSSAFSGCTGLTDLTIGNGVTSIGENAFFYCTSLNEIYFEGSAPSIGSSTFYYVTATAYYYPDETWTEEVRQNYGGTITWVAREVQPTIIASGTCGENLTWTLDDQGTLTISGTGAIPMFNMGVPWDSYKDTVKKIIIESGVTSIGMYALAGYDNLTSVTIGDSVSSIDDNAFLGNTELTSIQVAEGNPVYHSAGNCLIETESKTLILGCKTSQIPADGSVTSIGSSAFSGCTGLTSITIPESVTSISSNAFYFCFGLTSIQVAEGNPAYHSAGNCLIETASKTLIQGCNTSQIPTDGSVTIIGDYAFYECTSLTSITIPDSVTSIGARAFHMCTGLEEINFNATAIKSVEPRFDEDGSPFMGAGINGDGITVNVGANVTIIPGYLFYYDPIYAGHGYGIKVKDVIFAEDSVCESVGYAAFYGCTSLTDITIPNSVTSIGNAAFYGCTSLTGITIPNSVTSIGNYAFEDCTGLTDLTIGNGVTSIGNAAFYGCTSLTGITIPNSVTSIGSSAFSGCTGLTDLTIGNGVTSIGEKAFYKCTGLTSIQVEDGNTVYHSAGNCLIETTSKTLILGCKTSQIPTDGSVTSIGNYAFEYCTGLTRVTIPNSVTSIGNYAFEDCTGLTDLTIGKSVTSIGDHAFCSCEGLTSITIPDSVTSIGDSAFGYCTGLTDLTIGNGVTSIGEKAFYKCTGLTSITIPDRVTSIGRWAFEYCTGLTDLTIGKSVTSIGDSAFYNCTSLTSVTIPDSVTSIGRLAFDNCTSLIDLTIGKSVTSIGECAFWSCTGLKEIYFEGNAPTFGSSVFYNVTATAYYYPDETWTEDVRQNYGGTITWVALKKTVTVTFKDESGNVISQAAYAEGEQITAPTVDEIANGRFVAYIFEGWGEDYTGICQGEAEYTAVGTGYTDLQEALNQETTATVTLVSDVGCKYLTVQDSTILDLNGHALTVDYFSSFGQVIDGEDGGNGLVKVNKGIHMPGENPFLPIYDSVSGGYRFYKYELQNMGYKTVDGSTNTLKAGFRLALSNTSGYSVLSNTEDSQLELMVYVNWTGAMGTVYYTFREETLHNYAALVAADIAAKGSSSKAITLTISGVDSLDQGAVLSVQPAMESDPGVKAQGENVTWTVQ